MKQVSLAVSTQRSSLQRKRMRQLRKELKVRRSVRRGELIDLRDPTMLEHRLLAMRRHLEVGHDLLGYWHLQGVTLGGGIQAASVFGPLMHLRTQVNRLLQYAMFESTALSPSDLQMSTDIVAQSLQQFAAQVMILPLSLEVFSGAKAKDCRVVLNYGGKLTSIEGTQFNGKCSRILLDLHPDSEPRVSLVHRKKTMGIFMKERVVGQWTMSNLHSPPEDPDSLIMDLLFTEDQPGKVLLTARASLQLEWFPKPHEKLPSRW